MNKLTNIFNLFFLLICIVFAFPIHSESADKAIIVFDASGSMMGQIKGKPKIDIARSTIEKLLKGWDSNILLGIITYGHRAKGDCKDIESIVPLGKMNTKAVMSTINKINPKGKTPLSSAVKLAAEQLKYIEDKATVILVSDGRETCNADPCALATELEKKGIDFTVHVIGFDMTEEEQAQLTCLAKNTGGKFYSADNANELHQALIKSAKMIAQPKPKKEKKNITGLKLQAVLTQGGEPIKRDMVWHVYEAEKDAKGNRKKITHTQHAIPLFRLNAGKYYVLAKHGNTFAETLVEVNKGKLTEQTVNLHAGHLRLHAVLNKGSNPIKESMMWHVYEAEKDVKGNRKKVTHTRHEIPLFILNSGKYYVLAKHGSATGSFEVEINEGEIAKHTVILNAGYLKVNAILKKGGDPIKGSMMWHVYEAEKDAKGNRKKITHTQHAIPLFRLNAGKYFVSAKHFDKFADFEIKIVPGKILEKTIVLKK
ncbi:MAG: VWA domain-containing protein [Deltaproteobacteria bacterium]|nr:VWA domain-containing protein [Deltaproteobacteria bacterium]